MKPEFEKDFNQDHYERSNQNVIREWRIYDENGEEFAHRIEYQEYTDLLNTCETGDSKPNTKAE
ncbi:MAG TPA: hypothetical protein VIK81_00085 [Patescibacteria group bacterium]